MPTAQVEGFLHEKRGAWATFCQNAPHLARANPFRCIRPGRSRKKYAGKVKKARNPRAERYNVDYTQIYTLFPRKNKP